MFYLFLSKLKIKHGIGFLALLAVLIWLIVLSYPNQKLKIVFCNVGQGDAILIQKGTNQILVDAGPDRKVLDCLSNNMPFWDRTIEMMILTHPEADHLDGFNFVLERYKLKYFLSGPEGKNSTAYINLISNLKSQIKNIKLVNPYLGEKITLAGISLTVLWPELDWVSTKITNYESLITGIADKDNLATSDLPFSFNGAVLGMSTIENLNNFSLAFLLEYGDSRALFLGDADSGIQEHILLNNTTLNKIDILKVPHHGARLSLSDNFLEKVIPKVAVISVGKNSFGHPDSDLIKKMQNLGIRVRRTDLEGEIMFEF